MSSKSLTLTTCFYNIPSTHTAGEYRLWAANLLNVVSQNATALSLVIYTDQISKPLLPPTDDLPNVAVIEYHLSEFYGARHVRQFKHMHEFMRGDRTRDSWHVLMVQCEKVWMLRRTVQDAVLGQSDLYAWCDLGYFRVLPLSNVWPSPQKLEMVNPDRVLCGVVNRKFDMIRGLMDAAKIEELPCLPPGVDHFSSNFFITGPNVVEWLSFAFDNLLKLHFLHEQPVRHDRSVWDVLVAQNPEMFVTLCEPPGSENNIWIQFHRILG